MQPGPQRPQVRRVSRLSLETGSGAHCGGPEASWGRGLGGIPRSVGSFFANLCRWAGGSVASRGQQRPTVLPSRPWAWAVRSQARAPGCSIPE